MQPKSYRQLHPRNRETPDLGDMIREIGTSAFEEFLIQKSLHAQAIKSEAKLLAGLESYSIDIMAKLLNKHEKEIAKYRGTNSIDDLHSKHIEEDLDDFEFAHHRLLSNIENSIKLGRTYLSNTKYPDNEKRLRENFVRVEHYLDDIRHLRQSRQNGISGLQKSDEAVIRKENLQKMAKEYLEINPALTPTGIAKLLIKHNDVEQGERTIRDAIKPIFGK